jgi:hypothetical protein
MRLMPVELNRRRFTCDDYQRMGTAGILSDVRYQRGQSIASQALPDSVIALEMLLA